MKKHLALAAILAATLASAAQAQSITSIARYGDHTVALSSMPCPANQYAKTAIYNSYGPERGVAYGCWTSARTQVTVSWFRVNTTRQPPESLPIQDFENVEN